MSTLFLSFITLFTSFPMYLAGFSMFNKISSLNANFLIVSNPVNLSHFTNLCFCTNLPVEIL